MHARLREAQALLRHQIPDGDLEKIFDRALEALLANLRKQKLAATERPRGNRSASGAGPNDSPSSARLRSGAPLQLLGHSGGAGGTWDLRARYLSSRRCYLVGGRSINSFRNEFRIALPRERGYCLRYSRSSIGCG